MPYEDDDEQPRKRSGDEALLREIRDRYAYAESAWEKVRKERQKDMRFICGDPWEPEDRKARADAGRPCINHDELGQFINQGINNLRQNKRGIKVEPRGTGANEDTAELRQDKIRTIEYESQAQDVYLKAGQDMFEGSYGFFRITRRYVHDDPDPNDPHAFDQKIVIKPIPNPDSVLYDPDCKEPDWSDACFCFVVEPMARAEFERRYPDHRIADFTTEDLRAAKQWVSDKTVMVAEYWKVKVTASKLKVGKKRRSIERKTVCQYFTNGLEVLDEIEQPGKEIPIPSMIGLERYVDEGSGPERKLFSLVRLAREPQMSLAYLCTQELEEAGMSPKVPVMGYVGQFDTDADAWETLNKVPRAYVQIDPVPDPMNPTQVLPLPQWRQFVPNFQQYELAKDGARRAIMSAMGISPLPTSAQRQNQKSGIALDHIQEEQAVGSLHFVAGFDRAIVRAGRIIDSWLKATYDNEREEWLHTADESRRLVHLNTAEPYVDPKTGETEHHQIGDEEHDVTISAAPSVRSQREAVSQFLDNLIGNLGKLPVPPAAAGKLLALAIQMKELGPKGDEMAEIISPTQGDQMQQLQGIQQQMQQQQQVMQQLQGELQKLQLEKQGKVIDNQYKMALEQMRLEADVAKAEITTKAQSLEERIKYVEDLWQQLHSQAHDAASQAADQAHQQSMADQQRQAAAEQQQQMQAQQQQPPDAQVQQ